MANLDGLAELSRKQLYPERAAQLLGTAQTWQEAFGFALPSGEREIHDRGVAALRTVLPEETFAAAWAQGREMTLEEAVAYALQEPEDPGNDG